MEGATYTFGVSGDLYDDNLLLYDQQTKSEWLQIAGTAVEGKLAGQSLQFYPVAYDTWGDWKARHPEGKVLSIHTPYQWRYGNYDQSPYAGYENGPRLLFGINHDDRRLPRKARVIGVEAHGAYKAYPSDEVWQRGAIEDRVGETELVLLADRASSRIGAFARRDHHFSLKDGAVVDEHGNTWTWEGAELSSGDVTLRSFAVVPTFWFAWATIHPASELYAPATRSTR